MSRARQPAVVGERTVFFSKAAVHQARTDGYRVVSRSQDGPAK
jgi:hypothetical protein